jgi:tetratricopeptide (TPR) repeat protein
MTQNNLKYKDFGSACMRFFRRFSLFLLSGIFSCGTVLADIGAKNSELALLPEFCMHCYASFTKEKYLDPSPRMKYWESVNGPDQLHIHHYCYSLIWLGRAQRERTNPRMRKEYYENALKEIAYPIKNLIEPKYRLLPEIYTNQGISLTGVKRFDEANASFENAIANDPKYVRAYGFAAENRYAQQQKNEARKWAQKGLELDPNNGWLKELVALSAK